MQVKYAGTSGIWIEKLTEDEVVMSLKNRFRFFSPLALLSLSLFLSLLPSLARSRSPSSVFSLHVDETHSHTRMLARALLT